MRGTLRPGIEVSDEFRRIRRAAQGHDRHSCSWSECSEQRLGIPRPSRVQAARGAWPQLTGQFRVAQFDGPLFDVQTKLRTNNPQFIALPEGFEAHWTIGASAERVAGKIEWWRFLPSSIYLESVPSFGEPS
jgi:hypothetical protein